MSPKLREGIDAAKRGDKATARRLLQQVLSTDGNNELALMWMASVVDALEERRFYLERALRVNPNNTRAREALKRLGVTEPTVAEPARPRATTAARPAARPTSAPNTNLFLIAAAVVAIVVIGVIVASAISSLQPQVAPTSTSVISAVQDVQATTTARALLSRTPTVARAAPTATVLPGIVVTLDTELIPTLPPTFTPTFTQTPTETPVPTETPLPLSRFSMIYSDVEEGLNQASLYRARADGTGETKLASGADGGFNDVDYDPINQQIVFVRKVSGDGGESVYELFVAPLDAPEDAQQITEFGATLVQKPRWMPDGRELIYTSNQDGDEEVWLIKSDGTGLLQLTNNDVYRDFDGDINTAGSQIVFASERNSPGFSHIFVMTNIGTDAQQITNVPISNQPRWSPDGTRTAYVNNQQGDDDIYVMDADGQRSFLLTVDDGGALDYAPTWSPDGRFVFFASNRDGGEFRWFAVDLSGNVEAITVPGRTPQTLSFITD